MTDQEWEQQPCDECSGTNKTHTKECRFFLCSACLSDYCLGDCQDYDDQALDNWLYEEATNNDK